MRQQILSLHCLLARSIDIRSVSTGSSTSLVTSDLGSRELSLAVNGMLATVTLVQWTRTIDNTSGKRHLRRQAGSRHVATHPICFCSADACTLRRIQFVFCSADACVHHIYEQDLCTVDDLRSLVWVDYLQNPYILQCMKS